MKAELYEFLLENKYCHGIMFKKSMETFVTHYNMVELVEEESLMRAFLGWGRVKVIFPISCHEALGGCGMESWWRKW